MAVEAKVKAATGGAGAGFILTEAVLYLLDTKVLTPGVTGDLPAYVSTVVPAAVGMALAWAAGYTARHTRRPDLAPPAR